MREGSIFTTSSRLAEDKDMLTEEEYKILEDHLNKEYSKESKRSSLPSPTILKYPRNQ